MRRKIIHLSLMLTLFLVITGAVTPAGNTVTWPGGTRLTTFQGWDIGPSILQMNDGRIWVAWQSSRPNTTWNFDIFYKIYDWSSWSGPSRLTTNSSHDISASFMQTNDGTIWLFWASDRTGNYELFCKNSSDNGVTWSNATQLTENSGYDWCPSAIQATDDMIWLFWEYDNGTDFELFCKNSSDNGVTWSNATQLTMYVYNDESPSIAQMRDGTIWVVWQRFIPGGPVGDTEIFYKTYNESWSNATQLTEEDTCFDWYPSIMQARDGTIWVFWTRELQKGATPPQDPFQDDLFYKTSVDNGATWSEDIQLTTNEDWNEGNPSATQISDKRIWLVLQSNENDERDIYYQNSSEVIFHDVAITTVTPNSTMVNRNETVSISVAAENQGDYPENFTVNCYANMTLIGSENVTLSSENSTTTVFSWDTTGFAPGPYTITATASAVPGEYPVNLDDNTFTDGTVTILTHDVAITNVTPSSTSLYSGNPLDIYVEVKNEGHFSETFNVTSYYNSTAISTQTVTDLAPDNSTTLTFTWDTTSVSPGNYTMSATAEPVLEETDTADNTLVDGTVLIRIPGDIDGDGDVDRFDFGAFADAYGSKEGDPNYILDADLDRDGDVDKFDFWDFADHFGEEV